MHPQVFQFKIKPLTPQGFIFDCFLTTDTQKPRQKPPCSSLRFPTSRRVLPRCYFVGFPPSPCCEACAEAEARDSLRKKKQGKGNHLFFDEKTHTLPETKWMVGIFVSFWDGPIFRKQGKLTIGYVFGVKFGTMV